MLTAELKPIVDAVVAARDFCGNETEAMLEAAYEHHVTLTAEDRRVVRALANRVWARSQEAAGVPEKYWVA